LEQQWCGAAEVIEMPRINWKPSAWSLGLILRELVGWLIIVLGLNIFRICFHYLDRRQVIEGLIAAIMGVLVFRGGLQLVKVAVAARAFVREQANSRTMST
jgi:hypothetical protein